MNLPGRSWTRAAGWGHPPHANSVLHLFPEALLCAREGHELGGVTDHGELKFGKLGLKGTLEATNLFLFYRWGNWG